MKKTLLFLFLMATLTTFAQQSAGTSGAITLKSGYSVDLAISSATNKTTMTLVFPDNVWFAIGFGGSNMSSGADVFRTDGTAIVDAKSTGRFLPSADASQDWVLVSNNTSGGVRTMVVERDNNTGDTDDFVFSSSAATIPIMWAHGTSTSYAYHGGNKGGTVISTLSARDNQKLDFAVYPNPATNVVNIQLPNGTFSGVASLFDLSGRLISTHNLSRQKNQVNLSSVATGIYFVRIDSENGIGTKRIIKN